MSTWREKPTSPDDLRAAIQSHRANPDRFDLIPPRVRTNVKQLATGKWQPEITVESFDADPLTAEGRDRIHERLWMAMNEVDLVIASREAPVPT
jgi:hypothetical protein